MYAGGQGGITMIISQSNVEMTASHQFEEFSRTEERLRMWVGNPPNAQGQAPSTPAVPAGPPADTVELSPEALALQNKDDEFAWEIPDHEKIKLKALLALLEAFTGKKLRFKFLKIDSDEDMKQVENLRSANASPAQPRAGWGLEYDYSATRYEHEAVQFQSSGTVKTADGREISFSVNMNLERSFLSHEEFHLRAGDALRPIDPLVINFGRSSVALGQDKFEFDLDNDGQTEMISFVAPGSGFLALDINGDGIINNGGELFGPQTGNGFAELARYDLDGNNWIDENDDIYDKLRIWIRDEQGKDVLFALGQKGIGAIFLGSAATPFALKDSANQAHGQLLTSGVFLHESGEAGVIQQIDLLA